MKNEYSKKEIERILRQEVGIPDRVQDKINNAYSELGIDTKVTMKYTKRHRALAAVAIVAALAVGTSVVTLAANKFLSANLIDRDGEKIGYDLQVDRTNEAHKIKVETTYMPDGYELGDENSPYGGKWHNYETDGGITIIPYNAAELDRMQRTGQAEWMNNAKANEAKSMNIGGMKTDMFVSDDFYVDSDKTVKNLYLFNEEFGYCIWISSSGELQPEELAKVAEGLKVTVLDEVVPYATEEEIAEENANSESMKDAESAFLKAGVPKDAIFKIGQEVKDPTYEANAADPEFTSTFDDIRYTVQGVEIKDSLPLDAFPAENYRDYDNEIAPWLNEDGTLKPRERYKYPLDGNGLPAEQGMLETVQSKFVVVKMKARNNSGTQSEWNQKDGVEIAPSLRVLIPRGDGNCDYPSYDLQSANENYGLQGGAYSGSSFPIYFDKMYYAEGVQKLKHSLFRPLAAGEELEYTLAYVMDEDQLDNMYLWFFSGEGAVQPDGSYVITPYVKISK